MNAFNLVDIQETLVRLESKIQKVDLKMEKLTDIEQKVSIMSSQFTSFKERVTSLETKVNDGDKRLTDVETSRAFDSQQCDEVNIKCTQLEADLKSEVKKCENLSREMNELKKEKAELKEDVLDVQARSMRDNLLFQGVPECDSFGQRKEEKCDEKK